MLFLIHSLVSSLRNAGSPLVVCGRPACLLGSVDDRHSKNREHEWDSKVADEPQDSFEYVYGALLVR